MIRAMDVWHLALPVASRRDHGIGTVAGACEIVVVRLTDDAGNEGWGEAAPWAPFTGTPEASFHALDRYFRPLVIGRSVDDAADIVAAVQVAVAHCTEAKAALETALLDLEGRIKGKSVSSLLNPDATVAVSIPLSVSLANPDFDADLALLARLHADGIRIVKLKTGTQGPEFDRMRVQRIKSDYADVAIRVDYNQGLTPEDAMTEVPAIAELGPDFIEQPVRAHEFTTMADLRARIDVPLLADESVFGPEDMSRAVEAGICDGVSIKIMKSGGLRRAQTVAQMAADAGLLAYGGDMFESGLGHLAGAHMIAATPEITLGCEFYQATYYLTEDILAAPFPVENGAVQVPTGPGLGVAPDIDRIVRHAIQHGDGT